MSNTGAWPGAEYKKVKEKTKGAGRKLQFEGRVLEWEERRDRGLGCMECLELGWSRDEVTLRKARAHRPPRHLGRAKEGCGQERLMQLTQKIPCGSGAKPG